MTRSRYERFAWGTLGFNVLVILWGAFVRASGAGAGCGSHWPLCNGEVVPHAPAVATMIEFGHRLTSGVALLLVVGLVVFAWRLFPRGHLVRRAAAFSGFFIVTEALIGAGVVLLRMVADNASVARGFWVSGHLMNTFLLVAALALTAWWAGEGRVRAARRGTSTQSALLFAALGGVLLLGVSGAVTALGDTLFRVDTLAEAKAMTFSDSAHIFVRLRLWHPALAVAVGVLVGVAAWVGGIARGDEVASRLATAAVGVYLMQLGLGVLNVWFLAPIPLQLAHLLLSDLIWIALVLLTAHVHAPGLRPAPYASSAKMMSLDAVNRL